MASTPEGKVKKWVKDRMAEVFGDAFKALWPVLNGMGAPAVDMHGCLHGRSLLIETKKDIGNPFIDWYTQATKATPRQNNTLAEFAKAGSLTYVIDSKASLEAMIVDLIRELELTRDVDYRL